MGARLTLWAMSDEVSRRVADATHIAWGRDTPLQSKEDPMVSKQKRGNHTAYTYRVSVISLRAVLDPVPRLVADVAHVC